MAIADGLIVLVVLAMIGGFITWLITWLIRHDDAPKHETGDTVTREYNRLVTRAAQASRKGHEGEANVYAESAQRLLDAWMTKIENREKRG